MAEHIFRARSSGDLVEKFIVQRNFFLVFHGEYLLNNIFSNLITSYHLFCHKTITQFLEAVRVYTQKYHL